MPCQLDTGSGFPLAIQGAENILVVSDHEAGSTSAGTSLEKPQQEVQRWLGKCLLRIQYYERLLKALLVDHELVGPVETLEAQRRARAAKLADKSLGTLVKLLFESYVVPEAFERDLLPDEKVPKDRISFAFSMRLPLTETHLSQTKAAIEELVALRNEMVHHLIERFDLGTEQGCLDALAHLKACAERVDRHMNELRSWAKAMMEGRAAATAYFQSPEFTDWLMDGIHPDGSVDWAASRITRCLKDAVRQLGVDDWVHLERAVKWMSEHHPQQTPAKYGCSTWKQVLSDSRQFELVYRVEDGRRVPWFRLRGVGASKS